LIEIKSITIINGKIASQENSGTVGVGSVVGVETGIEL